MSICLFSDNPEQEDNIFKPCVRMSEQLSYSCLLLSTFCPVSRFNSAGLFVFSIFYVAIQLSLYTESRVSVACRKGDDPHPVFS